MTKFENIKNMTIDQFADWLIGQKGLNVGHGTDAWKYHMETTVNWLNEECHCPCTGTCKCTEWREDKEWNEHCEAEAMFDSFWGDQS